VFTENYGNSDDQQEIALSQKMLRETDPTRQHALMRGLREICTRRLGARRVSAMVVPDRAAPILCEGWKVGPSHYLNQDLGTVWLDQ
jgi:hypothetical protein